MGRLYGLLMWNEVEHTYIALVNRLLSPLSQHLNIIVTWWIQSLFTYYDFAHSINEPLVIHWKRL